MATIGEAIYAKLAATAGVTSITPRIRVHRGEQNIALPYLTYQIVSDVAEGYTAGNTGTRYATVQIDSWAASQSQAVSLANAVRACLSGWSNSSSPDTSPARLQSEVHEYEEPTDGSDRGIYRVRQDYYCSYAQ